VARGPAEGDHDGAEGDRDDSEHDEDPEPWLGFAHCCPLSLIGAGWQRLNLILRKSGEKVALRAGRHIR